ncbi:hypothetical protein RB195_022791 [Necator americanus]|uniref:Uncharacterized protein n=1 Tax=Necator americanus TaxID=51031 RepID=A0ABR1EIU2_NECAM
MRQDLMKIDEIDDKWMANKHPIHLMEAWVDSRDGLLVSAVPGLAHNTTVSRTSVQPKACDQVTERYKGGGWE